MTKVEKEKLRVAITLIADDFNFLSKKAYQYREEGNRENASHCFFKSTACIEHLSYFKHSNFIDYTIKNNKYEQIEVKFLF